MAPTNSFQRLAPFLEGLERRILQTAFGEFDGSKQTSPGLLDQPLQLPEYQVAGIDPLQAAAIEQAQAQFGSFQPFMNLSQDYLLGSTMAYDPMSYKQFMNPFQDEVIKSIEDQFAKAQNRLNMQSSKFDAFGGSRQGIASAELARQQASAVGTTNGTKSIWKSNAKISNSCSRFSRIRITATTVTTRRHSVRNASRFSSTTKTTADS